VHDVTELLQSHASAGRILETIELKRLNYSDLWKILTVVAAKLNVEIQEEALIDGEVANLASAAEGARNQTLFRSTASLASLGLREGEILHHQNRSRRQSGCEVKSSTPR
jgi:hypothetical protein